MASKVLCRTLPFVLLAGLLPVGVSAGDNVGKIYLTFKYCKQNIKEDKEFRAEACTDAIPAGGARIVFREPKGVPRPDKTGSDGVIKGSIQTGVHELTIYTPPPKGVVPRLLSSNNLTRINVSANARTVETFYLILPVDTSGVLNPADITIGVALFQKASYKTGVASGKHSRYQETQPQGREKKPSDPRWTPAVAADAGDKGISGRVIDPLKHPVSGARVTCSVLIESDPGFRSADLKDPTALALKLRDAPDLLAQYLQLRLTPDIRQRLANYDGFRAPSDSLKSALVAGLNQLLEGPGLFDAGRFARIKLSDRTRVLLEQQPEGVDLIRLNRGLLQDAYPNLIARGDMSDQIIQLDETETDAAGGYKLRIPADKKYGSYGIGVSHDMFYPKSVTVLWGEEPDPITLEQESVATESQTASTFGSEPARRAVFLPQLMQTLPVPGVRSFDYFGLLAAGVAPPPETVGGSGPGVSPGVGTAGQFAVNGVRSRENDFTMDGSDNNDEDIGTRRQGFVLLTPQPIETLQEYQIITALPDARFGRNSGGHVNALTQSGSFGVHGQVYGFFTHDRFNARNRFDQTTANAPANFTLTRASDGVPVFLDGNPLVVANPVGGKDKLRRSQAGIVLGGEIQPLKTFFFGSYELLSVSANRESHFAVPTIAQRGIFGTGETGLLINDPFPTAPDNRRLFPASIPGNAIFSLYPFPNNPDGPYAQNTYSAVLPADANGRRLSGKLSRQFGDYDPDRKFKPWHLLWARGNAVTGRYNLTQERSILPASGGAIFSSLRPRVRTQNVAFFVNRTIAQGLTDTIRVSVGRTRLTFDEIRDASLSPSTFFPETPFLLNAPLLLNVTQPNLNGSLNPTIYVSASSLQGRTLLNTLGYGPVKGADEIAGPLGQVVVPGFSPLGVDSNYFPQSRANTTIQVADTISYVHQKHIYSFGFDVRKTLINSTQDRGFRPQAVFNGLRAFRPLSSSLAIPGPTGSPFTKPTEFSPGTMVAAGVPTGLFQTLAVVPDSSIGLRFTQFNFFVQDEWRVRPNLSVTLGLRYELNTVPETVGQRLEQALDPDELTASLNTALPDCLLHLHDPVLCNNIVGTIRSAFPADFKLSFGADKNDFDARVGFAWDPTGKGDTSVRGGFGTHSGQFNGLVLGQSRNAFPDFLPLNFADFPYRRLSATAGERRTFLFNLANPLLFQADGRGFDVIRPGTLNTLLVDPVAFLVNGRLPTGNRRIGLDLVLPQRGLSTPYSLQYGITVERVLGRHYLVSVAYVGTRGLKLLRVVTPEKGVNLSRLNEDPHSSSISQLSNLAHFPFICCDIAPSQNTITKSILGIARTFFESTASSTYHSLQVDVRKRYSQNFQVGTTFTYAHSIDDASDYLDTAGALALPQNSLLRSERGPSGFDVRLRSATNFVVDLPQKWQASGVLIAQTGQPFTVNTVFDINRDGNLTDRLNSVEGIVTNPRRGDGRVLGLSPGTDPMSLLAADGQDGAVGRNTFRGHSNITFDVSFMRSFTLGAESKVQFRTEVFNLFNHTNFALPERLLESPAFGRSVRTITPARMVQFGFKVSF